MKASPENFTHKVKKILEKYEKSNDIEFRHMELDKLMWDYLTKVGCGEGVELIRNTPKWYAQESSLWQKCHGLLFSIDIFTLSLMRENRSPIMKGVYYDK